MNRRKFIKNSILGTFGLGMITGLYTWQIEPFWLEFVKKKMPIKNLPNHLIGKTLIQISDIHIGNRFDYQFIIDSFEKAKAFNPDFVVYTGDYVSYENEQQFEQLSEVLTHAVKGRLGTFAVLGNHDYGKNWLENEVADTISDILENVEISVLRNEQKEKNGLNFIGIDDFLGTNFHPEKVMNLYDETKANLVLCHNPDVCDLPVWNNYQGWILSLDSGK